MTSNHIQVAAGIVAMSVALASIVFMSFVFWNEAVLGRGVGYIEPNRSIALTELLLTAFGFTATVMVFIQWLREKSR